MKKLVLIGVMCLSIGSCASNQKSSAKLVGGARSAGSAKALLGSYGLKTGNIFNPLSHGYQRMGVPKWQNVAIKKIAEAELTSAKKRELENAGVQIQPVGGISGGLSSSSSESYKIVYMEILDLSVLRKELRQLMREDVDVRDDLRDKNARIVIMSGIVFDHDAAKNFNANIQGNAKLANVTGSPEITFKASSGRESTIKIGDKTVVEYQFGRLCWKGGRLRSIVRDSTSIDASACPSGSSRTFPG